MKMTEKEQELADQLLDAAHGEKALGKKWNYIAAYRDLISAASERAGIEATPNPEM